jgi:membrane fusion protein, multidrug efflux system
MRSLLVVTCALAGCSSGRALPPRTRPPPLVTVAEPEVRDLPITLSYTVDLRPIEQADLQSKVAGYVQRIYVDRGDTVKRGQLLVEVRPSDLPEQVNQAREAVGQAEASFKLADENARRARDLFQRGMVSKAELDQAEAQVEMARSARGGARSGLGVVSTRLAETQIVAPFTGQVAKRYLDPGALVQPGPQNSTILTLMKIDKVRVFVSVLENQAPLVHVGQTAEITVDALPARKFSGTVTRVPPALDPNTRTLECEIVIPNPKAELKPGMYGRASLTVATHPAAVVLPVEAVVTDDKERAVYVVEDVKPQAKGAPIGRARRVLVETGFDGGDWLEVVRGLTGGQTVILSGVDLVADGAPVAVARKNPPPTAERRPPASHVD